MSRPPQSDRGLYSRTNRQQQVRWYVRISAEGRYQRFAPHGGFPTKREARMFLDTARADLRRGKFFPEQFKARAVLVASLLDSVPQRPIPNAKNETAYRAWWHQFAGHLDARHLLPSLIDQARAALEAKHLSAQTVHHYLKYLRRVLNLAKRDRVIEESPFERLSLAPVQNLRERFYSHQDRRRLLKALGPLWREAAELAGLTGLRWSEQFQLERARVKVQEGYLILPTTKAKRPQTRLLNTRAKVLCRAQLKRSARSRWLYPNQTNTGPLEYANFKNRVWVPARNASGVTNARWNDWRHTFASDLTMAGHSDRTVADLLGHTSTQMVKRYAHLAPSHLRHAVESIAKSWPTISGSVKQKRR